MLINLTARAGASRPPCDTAEANSHGDTVSRNPGQRARTATVAVNTAATASANTVPTASGGAVPASSTVRIQPRGSASAPASLPR